MSDVPRAPRLPSRSVDFSVIHEAAVKGGDIAKAVQAATHKDRSRTPAQSKLEASSKPAAKATKPAPVITSPVAGE